MYAVNMCLLPKMERFKMSLREYKTKNNQTLLNLVSYISEKG